MLTERRSEGAGCCSRGGFCGLPLAGGSLSERDFVWWKEIKRSVIRGRVIVTLSFLTVLHSVRVLPVLAAHRGEVSLMFEDCLRLRRDSM